MPVGTGQQPAYDQADERPGDRRDGVDAERHSPLVSRKASVKIAAALAMSIAPPTPCTILSRMIARAAALPRVKIERQPDGARGEDREAQVKGALAVELSPSAERDHEHRGDDQEAQQDPEQVTDVRGLQRVQPDAGEMASNEMITIEELMVTTRTPNVM